MLLGGIVGGILAALRVGGSAHKTPGIPVFTGLGYDQHNSGYENHPPAIGAALGYFGTIPSGA